jgi:hypothetical protein
MNKKTQIILEDLIILNREVDDIHIIMDRIFKKVEQIKEELKNMELK